MIRGKIYNWILNLFKKKYEFPEVPTREEYWNNKWKKSDIVYKAREDKINFDVRNFITYPDVILQRLLKKEKLIGETNDETAYKIMDWVQENIKYVKDSKQFGFNEHWDFPAEVLYRRKADCEGMTNLIVSLCENANIPSFKIKNCCGNVKYKSGGNAGGHSYPIYLRDPDDKWVDLDPCFYATKKKIRDRIPVNKNKVYGKIWFTFNSRNSWSPKNLELSEKRKSKYL